MNSSHYAALRVGSGDAAGEALTVELVFDSPVDTEHVESRIAAALPGAAFEVETVFGGEEDHFLFATFLPLRVRGRESEVFGFTRDLAHEIGAIDANPLLEDGLWGGLAVSAAPGAATLLACETPRDLSLPFGWVHPMIRTIDAWKRTRGEGSTVAVIDTGHSQHHELNGAILEEGQANFVEGGFDARDRFSAHALHQPGHGTLVCSVVAARGDATGAGDVVGRGGVTGAAPEARVLPIRAVSSVVNFRQKTIPRAIAHASATGADVIAMALGGPTRAASTERALRDAVSAGCVIVCAAGNCWPKVVFPAAYSAEGLCTATAALRHTGAPWARTGRGPEVTVAAPGENVWGAARSQSGDPDHGIRAAQGTTLASSLTAGVAALWVAQHGGRRHLHAQAKAAGTTVQAMFNHCVTRGLVQPGLWEGSSDLGAGILDAVRALEAPLPIDLPKPRPLTGTFGTRDTSDILRAHLAATDGAAAGEFDASLTPFAAELMWRSYRATARARAQNISALGPISAGDSASVTLRAALRHKPDLARFAAVH